MAYTELQKLIDGKYRQLNKAKDGEQTDELWLEIYALQEIQAEIESFKKFKEAAERDRTNWT